MGQINERLRQIVVTALRCKKSPREIQGDDLIAELNITSIDALEILIHVEIEFGIQVDDADLSHDLVSSLDKLEHYISARLIRAA